MAATPTTIARAAGISPKTLRAIMNGDRWATDAVQSQLEAVLRWNRGELAVHAVGAGPNGVDGLTDVELAAELTRRLRARAARDARLRASDVTKRGHRASLIEGISRPSLHKR